MIAVLTASALVLAACGGDDDTAETPTTDAATTTAPAEVTAGDEMTADASDEATRGGADADVPADWPSSIVFTLTPSQETGGLIETAQPLADMLAERLGIGVDALVPTDYAGVIVALQSGQAQVAGGLGPRQMVQAEEQAGAELILQAERFGSTHVRHAVDDERPRRRSATTPRSPTRPASCSATGCSAPMRRTARSPRTSSRSSPARPCRSSIRVRRRGMRSRRCSWWESASTRSTVSTAIFAGGHDNSVQAVYDGDAVAGTSFNDARGTIVEEVPDVGEQVVVFGWSGPIPNDGFAVAGDLPASLVEAITQAFVDITMDRRRPRAARGALRDRRPRTGGVE